MNEHGEEVVLIGPMGAVSVPESRVATMLEGGIYRRRDEALKPKPKPAPPPAPDPEPEPELPMDEDEDPED